MAFKHKRGESIEAVAQAGFVPGLRIESAGVTVERNYRDRFKKAVAGEHGGLNLEAMVVVIKRDGTRLKPSRLGSLGINEADVWRLYYGGNLILAEDAQ